MLIIEKSTQFSRRVGEATVELSAYFIGRVLGLMQHLNEAHITKQGFRFWFANERTKQLDDCSEIGGRYLSRVPAFQVDRAVLDEEVLRKARLLGAALWRPAAWTPPRTPRPRPTPWRCMRATVILRRRTTPRDLNNEVLVSFIVLFNSDDAGVIGRGRRR